MLIDSFGYNEMLNCLRLRHRFAWVRYSDGDWNCVFGRQGKILDEHHYSEDLSAALRSAMVCEPDYHLGIMPSLLQPGRWWASNRTIEFVARNPELKWCSSLILHNASTSGRLGEFFESLRGVDITVVSHSGMSGLKPWLGCFNHVVIPESDCWLERNTLEPLIISACNTPGVVLFSCSMPAKVWIRKAWMANSSATLIDAGSVLDPYIGKLSRSYMRDNKHKLAAKLY